MSCSQAVAKAEEDASTFKPWSLLEHEIKVLEGKIAAASDDEKLDLENEKMELENRKENLELEIEVGTLSRDEYIKKTKQILEREKACAKEFQKKKQTLQYKEADERCKVIQEELQG